MRITMLRLGAGLLAAAVIGLLAWAAPQKAMSAGVQVAQDTPAPTDTSSPDQNMNTTPANTNTSPDTNTAPANTAPAMSPGVPTYNGKPAGTNMLNDNPNGPSWLSKFARNPGPDTSNMTTTTTRRRVIIIHRVRTHPPKP